MTLEDIKKISELTKEALLTDGAHHKQHFLFKILKIIDPASHFDYQTWEVDEGIEP